MSRSQTKARLTAYETTLTAANDIPTIDAIVRQTSANLLSTVSGLHITKNNSDQLTGLLSKLEQKKQLLTQEHTRLTDENTQLNNQNLQSNDSMSQNISAFDIDVAGLCAPAVAIGAYSAARNALPLLRFNPYNATDWPDDMRQQYDNRINAYVDVPVSGSGRNNYNTAMREARSLYASLQTAFRSIRSDQGIIDANTTKIRNNTRNLNSIAPTGTTLTQLDQKIADITTLLTASRSFARLESDECRAQLTGTFRETLDDLISSDAIAPGLTFELRDSDGVPLTTHPLTIAGRAESCYAVMIRQADGTEVSRLIRQADLTIDPHNGTVTFVAEAQLYDRAGTVYRPPSGPISFDVYPTVRIPTPVPGTPPLAIYTTKKLTVQRTQVGCNRTAILTNPAFTNEFGRRMVLDHRMHIGQTTRPAAQISISVKALLDQHPEYAKLPDLRKAEVYRAILALPYSGGLTLGTAISPTQARNRSATPPVMEDHTTLFSAYMQSADVQPAPTADDQSSDVKYRNRLSRNLAALTTNYLAHRLNNYLTDPTLVQHINDTITEYTTQYDTQKLDGVTNIVDNIQDAARALRSCLPHSYGSQRKNDSWMRLLAGKGASVSDTITTEDGSTVNYTSAVQMRTGKGVSVTVTLGDGKPIIMAGATPGDILAKILSGCGGRINGQRERMKLAFGTMKAIIKTCKEAGVNMTVPINGTAGDELRIAMDDSDQIRVERYNYNQTTDSFERSTVAGDCFDEANPDHKETMTHDFLVRMNMYTNTILDRQYGQFRETMRDGASNINGFFRFMTYQREKMSGYGDNPWSLRGLLTKRLNRKEKKLEAFDFPIQTGDKSGTVSYEPNGKITIEIDGQKRSGKNLAKLLTPFWFRWFGGVFNRKKNITDGLEMDIMRGLYGGLSTQLMQNNRVNQYTYLVRDPASRGVMYAMYHDDDGNPQMGIIENVSRNIGAIDNTNNMFLTDWQQAGRCVGMPPQGVRQLDETERAALEARPDIMDKFTQTMLKSREEVLNVGLGGYASLSLNAKLIGETATAAVVGGINLATGGLLSTAAYTAGQAVNTAVTSIPSAAGPVWQVIKGTKTAISEAYKIPIQAGKGLFGMAA